MSKTTRINLTGQKFNRLLVKEFLPDDKKYSTYLCLCDCGNEIKTYNFNLTSNYVQSCGCLNIEKTKERSTIHGQSGSKTQKRTRTYSSWASMMDRCHWGGHKKMFSLYGAKGKIVCERWHTFENFYEDMGDRPDNTSIDRINNNGNYEPSNCRWADRKTQALNTSRTLKVFYKNKLVKVHDLIEELNLPKSALRARAQRRGNNYALALKTYGIECENYV